MDTRRRLARSAATIAVALAIGILAAGAAAAQQPPPTRPPLPPPTSGPLAPRPSAPLPTPPPPTLPAPATTAPAVTSDDDGGGDGAGGLVGIAGAAVLVAGGAYLGLRATRRRQVPDPGPVRPASAAAVAGAAPGPSPLTHELLEVGRQLTAAATHGDVRRAIVRGALQLVPADAAALVGTGPPLRVEAESRPETLVDERLADGVVGRVAETGESIAQVSATEPAVRHLPAAMIALPLVAGGRVDSVLVVLRAADLPFAEGELKVLRALVPMAAAALGTERHAQSAIDESFRDPLTGAHNRRRFDRDLEAALEEGRRAGSSVALAIIDLDHFKRVNDTHGHPAGDALLRGVVARVQRELRPGDALYRFGGEEFCLVLANTALGEAIPVAERVRAAIAAEPFDVGAGEPLVATASIGLSGTTSATADELLASADAALYRAKHGGRNRVEAA